MPILRLKRIPYYIAVNELVKLPVLEKFIMYMDKSKRNIPLDKTDIKCFMDFHRNKFGSFEDNQVQYIELTGKEAVSATIEMVIYHTYFYCRNTYVSGTYSSKDTSSKWVTLNDLVYPYTSWNAEVIYQDLIINSGDSICTIHYSDIERIVGYFNEFMVVLKDAIIRFFGGKIYHEKRHPHSLISVDYAKQFNERHPLIRLFNSADKRNYKDFVFYLNDNRIYSNPHARLYYDFETYVKANGEIFTDS